ncbi:hypothetical protein CW354_19300 [Marinicaulis flavus]|uniref:Uncharacterized protein n=1 Tax=Hyphococcus luteus TaxID=2058213 RepID=A0A2S7K1V8_9PROT|nr:hypothetical protein CW354_19300 [Marinicaulis flavus]
MAEPDEERLNRVAQAADRPPGGQPAPAEDVAKRLSASDTMSWKQEYRTDGLPSRSRDQSAFVSSELRRDSFLANLASLDKRRRLVGPEGLEPPT